MVAELLVTVTLALEIANVLGSPHADSDSARPSSTIAASRPKRLGILRAHRQKRLPSKVFVTINPSLYFSCNFNGKFVSEAQGPSDQPARQRSSRILRRHAWRGHVVRLQLRGHRAAKPRWVTGRIAAKMRA